MLTAISMAHTLPFFACSVSDAGLFPSKGTTNDDPDPASINAILKLEKHLMHKHMGAHGHKELDLQA